MIESDSSKSASSSIPSKQLVQSKLVGKLVLLCDFTGKIVFWKGDPKVLQTAAENYLHNSISNFNFSIHSRLLLFKTLTYEIFKIGHVQKFILQLIQIKKDTTKLDMRRKSQRHKAKKQFQRFFYLIKQLDVQVQCISAKFAYKKTIQLNKTQIQTFITANDKSIQQFERLDNKLQLQKFIMFEIQDSQFHMLNLKTSIKGGINHMKCMTEQIDAAYSCKQKIEKQKVKAFQTIKEQEPNNLLFTMKKENQQAQKYQKSNKFVKPFGLYIEDQLKLISASRKEHEHIKIEDY